MLLDLFNLFYPRLCAACGNNLYKHEKVICLSCLYFIPKTNFHLFEDNPVAQLFWGRVNIKTATAYYYYSKGSKFQILIHKLKYNNQQEIGKQLGIMLGSQLKDAPLYQNITMVIPVPLHPKKEKARGYNQSFSIAQSISDILDIQCVSDNLFRTTESSTQTKKSRYERFENVNSIFKLKNPGQLSKENILLVDDVITTGSTLEACAECILEVDGTTVSVAALAVA